MTNYEAEYDRWLNKGVDYDDQDEVLGHCQHCDEVVYFSEAHYKTVEELIHEECFVDYIVENYRYKFIREFGDV